MNNSTLGCWWVVIAKSLENKGIPRFSFRFESLSPRQKYGNDRGYSHIFFVYGIERDSRDEPPFKKSMNAFQGRDAYVAGKLSAEETMKIINDKDLLKIKSLSAWIADFFCIEAGKSPLFS